MLYPITLKDTSNSLEREQNLYFLHPNAQSHFMEELKKSRTDTFEKDKVFVMYLKAAEIQGREIEKYSRELEEKVNSSLSLSINELSWITLMNNIEDLLTRLGADDETIENYFDETPGPYKISVPEINVEIKTMVPLSEGN